MLEMSEFDGLRELKPGGSYLLRTRAPVDSEAVEAIHAGWREHAPVGANLIVVDADWSVEELQDPLREQAQKQAELAAIERDVRERQLKSAVGALELFAGGGQDPRAVAARQTLAAVHALEREIRELRQETDDA